MQIDLIALWSSGSQMIGPGNPLQKSTPVLLESRECIDPLAVAHPYTL